MGTRTSYPPAGPGGRSGGTPAGRRGRLRCLVLALVLLLSGAARGAEGGLAPLQFRDVTDAWQRWRQEHPPPADHPEAPYHFAAGIHEALAPWVAARPGVIRPVMVGRSVEHAPIWGFQVQAPGRPIRGRVLVFANLHALEWVGAEVVLAWVRELAAHPLPGVEVVAVPVVNVDGRRLVEADLRAGHDHMRRGNARGVDLNRDFAVHHEATSAWRHLLPGYHAASAGPLSQPEAQALDRLGARGFDLVVSLHAFGGFVYLPWSGSWTRPPGWRDLHALGTALSGAQGAHAYRVMQLSRWGFFFRAQGSEIDHFYGRHGSPAVLVELTRSGLSPLRPREWDRPFRRYNPRDPTRHVLAGVRLLRAGAAEVASGRVRRVAPPVPPESGP